MNRLPTDNQRIIRGFVDLKSTYASRGVCKSWNTIFTAPHLFAVTTEELIALPEDITAIKNICTDIEDLDLYRHSDVAIDFLNASNHQLVRQWGLPRMQLKKLSFGNNARWVMTEYDFMKMMCRSQDTLEHMRFGDGGLHRWNLGNLVAGVEFPKVHTFQIDVDSLDWNQFYTVTFVNLHHIFPNVKKLIITTGEHPDLSSGDIQVVDDYLEVVSEESEKFCDWVRERFSLLSEVIVKF